MFNFTFPSHIIIYLFCFSLYIIFEIIIRYHRNKFKKEYHLKKEQIHSSEEAEHASLDYFNRLQVLDITRIVVFFLILIVVLSIADIRAFSLLAVAIGAIIISLKDYIASLIAYIYVITNFDIGDDIRVGTVLGEIVRVRPMITSVAGKDEHGDFDGKLHHIPNSKMITEIVERQEIKNNNYRMGNLQVIYSHDLFSENFSNWLLSLKKYLDDNLVKRSLKDVGNYKSYAGIKYKLHYNYNQTGAIIVSISFVSRTKNYILKKESIIEYIETTRMAYSEKK